LPPNDSINPDHVSAVPENNKTCADISVKIVLCEQTERSTTCTIVKIMSCESENKLQWYASTAILAFSISAI
jgi:hypothetical protein